MANRIQSMFHGSDYRFRPEHIEPGKDGLIHLHLNPNPIRVSYMNIYHYVLDRPLESLPFVVDNGEWQTKTLVWDLTTGQDYLSSKEREDLENLRESDALEALFSTLKKKGIVGLRYVNAFEFPGISVAIFNRSTLLLPEEGFKTFYGKSFERDYEEAADGTYDDTLMASRYLTNMLKSDKIGHWPAYLTEFDELISEVQRQFIEDDIEDPDDTEAIARTIAEFNNITEKDALKGMKAVTDWKRLHPDGWSHRESPLSMDSLTEEVCQNNDKRLAYEVI